MVCMKKICFITTVHGTLQAFVLKTAEFLHENTDWDISFICNYDEEFANSLPEYIHYFPVKMERGISIYGVRAMLEIKKIFKREKFDLVQYSTPNASLYASLAGYLAKVPVRLYCQWGMAFVGFSGIKRKIFKAVEKFTCSLSTFIEPDSNSNLEFSISEKLYPREKGTVIWNGSACGVDINKFDVSQKAVYRAEIREKYNIQDSDFVFGFVGRITRDKGINELLSAFKNIVSSNKNAYLMIVGRFDNDNTINNDLLDWSKSSQNVIFVGPTKVVEQYLSAMDTFILPSYREGFGMGVIEAEAMGVPVIVTNIPGPIDAMVNGETGIIVNKKDIISLQDAMRSLMLDKDIVQKYCNNCIKHVQNNFEQQEFFKQVLSDRKKLLSE